MGMNRKRLVPRLLNVDALDIPAMESWLTDLAAKGLYYRKHNTLFMWFERGAPAAVRYRLDVVSPVSPIPDTPQASHAQAMGWRFLDKLGNYAVYFCDDPAAPELHTDPVTQSFTMDQLAKKLKRSLCLMALLMLASFAMVGFGLGLSDWPVLLLVTGSTTLLFPGIAVNVFLLCSFISQCRRFLKLRQCLRAGLPFSHKAGYRRQIGLNVGVLAFATVFALLSFYSAYHSITGRNDWNITAETPSPLDFHLSQIEVSPDFQFEHEMTSFNNEEIEYRNRAQFEWSLLAPVQYNVHESGIIPGRFWPGGQYEYKPSLELDYYGLALPFLAEPLLNDLIYRHLDHMAYEPFTREWLNAPGFDQLLLAVEEDGTYSMLFARRGGRVLTVRYHGTASLTAQLPALAALLQG